MADVELGQGRAERHLVRQLRQLVVGQIQRGKVGELHGELGRDLSHGVGGEIAGAQCGVPQEVVHGVGHLHQLALAQVELSLLHGRVAAPHDACNSRARIARVDDLRLSQQHSVEGAGEVWAHRLHGKG